MTGHFTQHPLYQNDMALADVTDMLLAAGHTIFQLFQMPASEEDHALWLLEKADPECIAGRVLSLGCGVGGMEAYWQKFRPYMTFELVNISQWQLYRSRCPGRKVWENAETYHSKEGPFDLVVLCYLLGHVNVDMTLLSALANVAPHGRLLIYDVFEGTPIFRSSLFYETPTFNQLEIFGTANGLRFRTVLEEPQIQLTKFFDDNMPWVAQESRPGLFVFQR
jgi:SAM-dependent methyltransferase